MCSTKITKKCIYVIEKNNLQESTFFCAFFISKLPRVYIYLGSIIKKLGVWLYVVLSIFFFKNLLDNYLIVPLIQKIWKYATTIPIAIGLKLFWNPILSLSLCFAGDRKANAAMRLKSVFKCP